MHDIEIRLAAQDVRAPQTSDEDEFHVAGLPLDCEAAARRAAADAETGGPAGRAAFAAPKRRPPRKGEIDTRRVLLRLRRDRLKARGLAQTSRAPGPARARASHSARAPRRASRSGAARGDDGDGGDGSDGVGGGGPHPRRSERPSLRNSLQISFCRDGGVEGRVGVAEGAWEARSVAQSSLASLRRAGG